MHSRPECKGVLNDSKWGIRMKHGILIAGKPEKIRNYVDAFQRVGVKATGCFECEWESIAEYQGLVLPGGGDFSLSLVGGENRGSRLESIDDTLDLVQWQLLEAYVRQNKPVLGICKGMQLINLYYGGTLIQHLPTAYNHAWRKEDQEHMTIALQGSFLEDLYGIRFQVNSAHHQGLGQLGRDLLAVQFAEDRVIEGIVHKSLPIYGVQWHPERMKYGDRLLKFWIQLFPKMI